METSEIKEKLKCSLEIAHIRSALAVASVLVAAYVGVMTLFWGNIAFTIVLCGVVLFPIWVAYSWRYYRVFRKIHRYSFHKVVLAQPHTSRFVHAFHFTVVLENTEKGPVTTKTSSIFLARGWLGPFMEDYVNREVTIAYNRATELVVVIG
jgi:ABC-type spermidine/putrescine transport system permease subunit II